MAIFARVLLVLYLFSAATELHAQAASKGSMQVGVAKIDITPYGPIRLSGYLRMGDRKNESEGVLQQLWAKAIAFGSDTEGPSVLITVDLAGIQAYMTAEVGRQIARQVKFNPANLSICASHTHSGPDMGNSHNMYFDPVLPVDQLARIAAYLDTLTPKLVKVAMEALNNRKPSLVSWGEGKVDFAMNRRVIKDGIWAGHGKVPDGPVDHVLPLMKITDLKGNIKGLFVSYACHGTTLWDNVNKTHGDWIGEAQRLVEENHPGAIALVAQGCGGDSDPIRRGKLEDATQNGKDIADEVERLLKTRLEPLTVAPVVKSKKLQLPFDHVPGVAEFTAMAMEGGAKGRNAEVNLDRMIRGIAIDSTMTYPLSNWTFGNKLDMLFMAGEVLADYSIRIKKELGANRRLWINAYANDVKAYIPSARVIKEGGYEVEGNMYYYDHPFRFSERIENIIIKGAHQLVTPGSQMAPARQSK